MAKVSMIGSTLKDATRAVTKYAQLDKSFAERLVFKNSVNGNIGYGTLYHNLGFDIFDRKGIMTDEGLECVRDIIRNNKLKYDSDWFEALKVTHQKWLKSDNPLKNKYTLFDYMLNPDFKN